MGLIQLIQMMEERRHFVRLDTRLETRYTLLPSGEARQATTKDIGGGGVCLFADKVIPAGTRLQVAMHLPGRQQPINFIGEVVWSEAYEVIGKEEHKRAVEVGVQFIEISPADREAVMQHVILNVKSPKAAS